MFKTLITFINALVPWFTVQIPTGRLNGDSTPTRTWFTDAIGFKLNFTQKNLQTITDRSSLNTEYIARAAVINVNQKKGIQALKIEIDQLYSFQKCFVARHRSRLLSYRDDLSQKGYRNMYALNLSCDNFQLLQSLLDSTNG